MTERVLVIGSGARENALSRKLAQSAHVKQILVAPGNTDTPDGEKISNSAVLTTNPAILKQFCKDHNIGLAVICPISLLSAGLVDELISVGVRCFGPSARAAQLEANKSFSKHFMVQHGIPTAQGKSFTNPHKACSFITYADFPALVVKANGLKTERDLYMAKDKDEACRAVQQLTHDWTCQASMETFIVEERLEGQEMFCMGFTDGTSLAPMPVIWFKEPQTGGNIASELPTISETIAKKIQNTVLHQAIDALRQEGVRYTGVLGARVMLTVHGPKVLGFKCGFQDMDSQLIFSRLKNDLYEVIQAAIDNKLCRCLPVWSQGSYAVSLALLSGSYLEKKETNVTDITQVLQKSAGCFELNLAKYKNPVLVCTMNSVGTKVQPSTVAHIYNSHSSVAQDLVALCTNDLLAQGTETLLFMPYLACAALEAEVTEALTSGLTKACKRAECALMVREPAQMPDVYSAGSYSLSGCAVGVVEKEHKLPQLDHMNEGDLIIGVHSSSIHSSSVAHIRRIMKNKSLQYSSLLPVGNREQTWDALCWKIPEIFSWLFKEGGFSEQEMICNFNCGIGAVLVAHRKVAPQILTNIHKDEEAWLIGALIPRCADTSHIRVSHLLAALRVNTFQLLKNVAMERTPTDMKKVAVYISATGTTLKLLIDTTRHTGSCARLSLVISNKSAVKEVRKAAGAGIPTRVIDHTQFGCQAEFEHTLTQVLEEFSIDLICMAGFVRTLSDGFRSKWKGKILNLYPSLSPPFKIENAKQQRVTQTALKVIGCSVCYMQDGANSDVLVLQETVKVKMQDTEQSLGEKLEEAKEKAVVKAIHLVASETVHLNQDGDLCWMFRH
ncbi:trifunctional purine biosynthetic protein adenosine-3-like [Bombina bombina]|uniref:trifunctional purine biosynthetic protein adenosine-3-like n=1 Tax=Bombina bombina TaxID=8345 RepID=UPI00235AAE23|nr:trifunctional purine biosynthetic protein adenosine-3-like [Bombina bombina]